MTADVAVNTKDALNQFSVVIDLSGEICGRESNKVYLGDRSELNGRMRIVEEVGSKGKAPSLRSFKKR